ncbi:MAG: hypothetical protein O7E52_09565 [Candidatus Poribacteria bacterium]|nr:hypothetical protein [Candidatus Poribacteria bacterium]
MGRLRSYSRYHLRKTIQDRKALTAIFMVLLGVLLNAESQDADVAQLIAMRVHFHAEAMKTRVALEFSKKVDYQQIPGEMAIQFELLQTTQSRLTLPSIGKSDPILKDFELHPSNNNAMSLHLFLHQRVKSDQFWLLHSPHPILVIDLYPVKGPAEMIQPSLPEERQTSATVGSALPRQVEPSENEIDRVSTSAVELTAPFSQNTSSYAQESQRSPGDRGMRSAPAGEQAPADTNSHGHANASTVMSVPQNEPRGAMTEEINAPDLWRSLQNALNVLLLGGVVWLGLLARKYRRRLEALGARPEVAVSLRVLAKGMDEVVSKVKFAGSVLGFGRKQGTEATDHPDPAEMQTEANTPPVAGRLSQQDAVPVARAGQSTPLVLTTPTAVDDERRPVEGQNAGDLKEKAGAEGNVLRERADLANPQQTLSNPNEASSGEDATCPQRCKKRLIKNLCHLPIYLLDLPGGRTLKIRAGETITVAEAYLQCPEIIYHQDRGNIAVLECPESPERDKLE